MSTSGQDAHDSDSNTGSGFPTDEQGQLNDSFSQIEPLAPHGHNQLTRACRHGRWYLLKSLLPKFSGVTVYEEMMRKEFDILMRLQHPNIVQTVGLADVPGVGRSIVMEWVEGVTLKAWLKAEHSRRQRLEIVHQLLDAVAYMHSQGIVHRDLKPSNIMVTTNGNYVRLIDFGLADNDVHALLKHPAGTAQYMAPEQATTSHPDVRNDIYSLGMVMKQMKLGWKYNGTIARCLKPIDKRFQSVSELREHLRRADNRGRQVAAAAAIAVAATLAGLILWQQADITRMNQRTALLTDSLQRQLDASAEQNKRIEVNSSSALAHIQELNDSLSQLQAANHSMMQREQERTERQRLVDDAITQALHIAQEANRKTGVKEHLDTVSRKAYLWVDCPEAAKAGHHAAEQYIDGLKGKFTVKELAEIEYAVNEYCTRFERQMGLRYTRVLYGD